MTFELIYTLKKDADEKKVLAFSLQNTQFQTNFNVNLTCLVPTETRTSVAPSVLASKKRFGISYNSGSMSLPNAWKNELETLNKRIHILRGFVTIFDALDEIIRIIRKSDGKADAAAKIMKRFPVKENRGKTTGARCRANRCNP